MKSITLLGLKIGLLISGLFILLYLSMISATILLFIDALLWLFPHKLELYWKDSAFKRIIYVLLAAAILLYFLPIFGASLLVAGIFLWFLYNRPRPAPHGENLPPPLCPTCGTPLILHEDTDRYYCRKCIKYISSNNS